MEKTKICNKCKKEKPLTPEFWHRHKYNSDGFKGICKECRNKSQQIYYQENKDRIIEYQHKHYEENRERRIAHQKEYYYNNKENGRANSLAYYHRNKEKYAKLKKRYWQEKKDVLSEYQKRWAKENREKVRLIQQRKYARRKSLPATLTEEQWTKIKQDFNNSCAYCNMSEEEHIRLFGEPLHQEHFIPLSKGGEYSHRNIIPSCKSCNSSKSNKDFFEWYPQYEFYSKENENFILSYLGYKQKYSNQAPFKALLLCPE